MVHRVSLHTVYLYASLIFILTTCMRSVVRPRKSIRRSGTRSSRTDTTSAATGSWSVHWPVAFGKDIIFGGALKSSGAPGSSSLAATVRVACTHSFPFSHCLTRPDHRWGIITRRCQSRHSTGWACRRPHRFSRLASSPAPFLLMHNGPFASQTHLCADVTHDISFHS